MRVHILHFANLHGLNRAFREVIESDEIETCEVEVDQLRLRFAATKRLADPLVEQLYQYGDLTWYVSHRAQQAACVPLVRTGEASEIPSPELGS